MAKKKSTSAAGKAAKKAKVVQKVERKEKKKVNKSKNKYDSEDEDDQDLEAILEKVCDWLARIVWVESLPNTKIFSRCERSGKMHILSLKNLLRVHPVEERTQL